MRLSSLILLFLASLALSAQEISNFSQFYVNPYLINPSFAGSEGRTGLYLAYRSQWTDFEGAPEVANLTFHTAINKSLGIGLNLNNDSRSILSTSSAMVSVAYAAHFTKSIFLRFGASAGGASNSVNFNAVLNDLDDPALLTSLESNMFLIGNAGLSLHVSDFHFGVSMPDLFKPLLFSDQSFAYELQPATRFIISASNRFYFANDKHIFEPYVLYRYHNILPPQIEAAAILHLNHAIWFGGTYKQDFGIGATAGFKIPKLFGVGYSYTFDNIGVNQIASPTHEVSINLLLGKRKKRSQKYSFISTIIEKEDKELEKEEEKIAEVKKPVEEEEEIVEEEEIEEEEENTEDEPIIEEESITEEKVTEEPAEEVMEEKPISENPRNDDRVVVKKGNHLLELPVGEYVVIGVYSTMDNAERYSDEIFKKGYHETKFGYISEKNLWYVFVHKSNDPTLSRQVRDDLRKIPQFKDAWVLGVEE